MEVGIVENSETHANLSADEKHVLNEHDNSQTPMTMRDAFNARKILAAEYITAAIALDIAQNAYIDATESGTDVAAVRSNYQSKLRHSYRKIKKLYELTNDILVTILKCQDAASDKKIPDDVKSTN
jgi:hypothetical protein